MGNLDWLLVAAVGILLNSAPKTIEVPLIESSNTQTVFFARGEFDCSNFFVRRDSKENKSPPVEFGGVITSRSCKQWEVRVVSDWNGGGIINISPKEKWNYIQVEVYDLNKSQTSPVFREKWRK